MQPRRAIRCRQITLMFCILAAYCRPGSAALAHEWNQWGGPERNFVAALPAIGEPLPQPKILWKRPLGKGHSAIVTDGEFGYSQHLDGDQEVLEKWRIGDGVIVWSYRYDIDYHASMEIYDGPHATPAIVADRVILVGIDARVHTVDLASGQLIWSRDLCVDYGTRLPQCGYACSPLVWRDRVIFPTLGESTSEETERFDPGPPIPDNREAIPGAVALDIKTGNEVWRSATFRSSHSSAIAVEIQNRPMLVFHGMFELVGVDPDTGDILWRQLLRRAAADNVSFTPIWDVRRAQFLVAHGYCDFGAQAIGLQRVGDTWQTDINWTNPRMQPVHTNAVLAGDILVGTNRSPTTLLTGVDVRNGKTVFRQRGMGKANLLADGSRLLILDENGELVSGRLGDGRFSESWRMPVLTGQAWTAPSISGRLLLLRDDREIRVYEFPL